MPLDSQIAAFLETQAAAAEENGIPPILEQTPEMARAGYRALAEAMGSGPDLFDVEDRTIPGPDQNQIPVRIYRPSKKKDLPILVYFHGGGWVIGDLDTHDQVCRMLSDGAQTIVVAVDYRLAPEHTFPAAVRDAYTALEWVERHAQELGGDALRLAVGGDSAGGNLAAVVSQLSKERGGPEIVFQLLVYPAVDMTQSHPSVEENGEGYVLTKDHMTWFRGHYLPDSLEWTNPQASPLHFEDLRGLPPALIITAEFDPLRDEGEEYARRLKAAGVAVQIERFEGQVHIFYQLAPIVDAARRAIEKSVAALRAAQR